MSSEEMRVHLASPIAIRFSKDFMEMLNDVSKVTYLRRGTFIRENVEEIVMPKLQKILAAEKRKKTLKKRRIQGEN